MRFRTYRPPLALESRAMFDAAALAVATDALTHPADPVAADGIENGAAPSGNEIAALGQALGIGPQIVFLADDLPDLAQLRSQLTAGMQVVMLDATRDGLQQIAEALRGQQDVSGVHLLTHGSSGQLQLGNTTFDPTQLDARQSALLTEIGTHLTPGADVLVYGCDFGAGQRGGLAVSALAAALGLDIAASDDATGSRVLGGDWNLEVRHGDVALQALSAADWEGLLGTQNVSTAEDTPTVGAVPALLGAAQLTSAPGHGSVIVTAAGVYTYTPDPNYNGPDSFTVSDHNGFGVPTTTTTVNITVTAVNDAPLGTALAARTGNDGASISIATAASFSDVDGDILAYSASGLPSGLGINSSTGVISGTLDANASAGGLAGVYAITVTVSDGNGGSASQALALTVSNPGPNATTDSATTNEDTAFSGNALTNDSDDDALTASLIAGPTHGTVTLAANGAYTYTPHANYNGSDSFTYQVTDAQGAFSLAAVNLTVNAVNDAPTIASPLGTVAQSTGVALTVATASGFSDADVLTDGQVLTYTATGLPPGLSINNSTGLITGTPTLAGNYTVVVTATDSLGASASQGLLLQLTTPNLPPLGLPLTAAVAQDGVAFSYNAGTAFSDPDGDALAFSASGMPAGLSINASTGVISGTPSPTASAGGTAGVYTVTVTANDGRGGVSSQALVLTANNPGPSAAADSASGLEDTVLTGNVLGNDSDDDALSAALLTPPLNGTVTVAANGAYTYTPHANFNGSDTFTYTVTDAQGASAVTTVTVTVGAVNDAPSASATPLGTVLATAGTPLTLATATAFVDVDVATNAQVLTYSAASLPSGLSIDAGTGVITGTTMAVGSHAINVTATDNLGAALSQTLTLQISAAHPPPVAVVDSAATHTNASVNINVLANDVAATGDTLSVTGATASHGTAVVNGDGTITYTPNAGYNGVDTIQYTLRDSSGVDALQPGLVTVTITPQNVSIALPTLVNLLNEDQPLLLVGLGGNTISIGDVNGNLISVTLSVGSGDLTLGSTANLTLASGDGVNDSSMTFSGLATDINAALAGLIYTPGADYNGPVTLNITALDTLLGLPVVTAQLPIGIAPVADVVDDAVLLVQDQPVSLNVLANDNFENPGRAVTSYTQGAHGSVTIDAAGNAVYTPGAGYYGPDSFTYTVTSNGTTETATVTLSVDAHPVAAAPLPPRAAVDGQAQSFNVAGAFNDPDGDTLTYSASGLPPGLSLDAVTGQVSGTLTPSASAGGAGGAYTVNITASDGKGGTLTRSFTFTVANPGPTANADSASGAEDTTISGNVLTNDSDDDGLTATLASGPVNGSVVLNADGSYVYTPAVDFNGSDTFTYTVTDAQGATSTATVTLTVTPVNDAPAGTTLAARSGMDGQAVSIATATAFSDADGQALTYSASGLPTGLTIDPATGAITGTLAAAASAGGSSGVYAITVTASDGQASSSQTFHLTVSNPGPTANADSASGAEDTTISGNVLTNDSDDDSLTATLASGPVNGSVVLNADGSYVYTPATNFNGSDTFTYTVTDAQGATSTATVTLTVTPVNDAPAGTTLAARSGVDGQAVSIATATAFSDTDGQALTYSASGLPTGLTIDPATGAITGTLAAAASAGGSSGVYAITVTASDGQASSSQTFHLTVSNPGPTANADSASSAEDTTISGNVLTNDSDDDSLTATLASGPVNGSVVLNADGSYVYTPATNFNGSDTFTYTVTDAQGATSTATVTLTVTPVNDAPAGTTLAARSSMDGQAVSIATAAAFTDPDGPAASYSATGLPPGLSIDASTGIISGTLTAAASAGGAAGVYSVTVTVSDGLGGTASQSFAFTASNPGPTANADSASSAEDTVISGNVLANDGDDDTHTASLASGPSHGSVNLNADGSYTYTPAADFNGTDTFTYTVTDAQGATATATVTVTIAAVNDSPAVSGTPLATAGASDGQAVSIATAAAFTDPDGPAASYSATGLPPGLSIDASTGLISGTLTAAASTGGAGGVYNVTVTANDGLGGSSSQTFAFTATNPGPMATADNTSVNESSSVSGQVLSNDTDDDTLTAAVASPPTHGSLIFNTDGTYTYTPTPGYNGNDSFTYTATDAQGATATATVTITVVAVNSSPGPSATPLTNISLIDGQAVSIDAGAAFTDPDGPSLSYSATGLPTGLSIHAVTGQIMGSLGVAASAGGAGGVYTVTVTADDGIGGVAAQTVQFTVSNPGPTAAADSASGDEDSAITGNVLSNDSDDDMFTATLSSGPTHGTVTLNPDGSYSYTANTNYSGSDSFTYTVTDAQGATAMATVAISVRPVNDAPAPSGTPLTAQTAADGQAVTVDTAAGFADVEGQALSYSATGLPPGLAIDPLSGVISGTLAANASAGGATGVYSVTVTASDGSGGQGSQAFTFTATNPGPSANADSLSLSMGSSAGGNVLANDSDDDTLTAALTSPPAHGSATLSADGSYTYTPNTGFSGTDTFSYVVTDAQGASATATVTLTVSPASNTPPTASGTPLAASSAADGQTVNLPTAGAFSDADGDALRYSAAGLPPGLAIDTTTGLISGTLTANASAGGAGGVYAVTVTASDGNGGTSSQTFTLTATNPAPAAAADSTTGAEDGTITGNVLANDRDDDTLTATLATAPSNGSVVVAADGSYTYTPDANFNGIDSFTYTVTDAQGGIATATVTVTVATVNDAPAASGAPLTAKAAADGQALALGTAMAFADADGDALSYSAAGLPPGLAIDPATGVISGSLAANASAGGAAGVYAVTVTASDGQGGSSSQTFNVTASNPGPTARPDTLNATSGVPSGGNVLANDSDDDTLTASLASAPNNGRLTLNADGSFSYTPNAGYTGTDTFSYTATDAQGATAAATVAVTVSSAPNTAPTVGGSPLADTSADDGQRVLLPTSGAFSDADGDALRYSATGLPPGLAIDAVTGVISGTLAAGASGAASGGVFTVTVTADDGNEGRLSQTFGFTATNPGPTVTADTALVPEDGAISGNLLSNDSDDDAFTSTLASGPAHGSVTLNLDGSYTYTPDANFNGTDTFSYTVTDAQGATATSTVSVTINAVNDAPLASGAALVNVNGIEGQALTLNAALPFSDADNDALSYSVSGLPPGLAINPATGVISGRLDPAAASGGTGGVYTVTVTAADGKGGSVGQAFTLTATNPPPVLASPVATSPEDTPVTGNVLIGASDDDSLAATLASAPANGSVTLNTDGSYTYTPNANFSGVDSFRFTVTDSQGEARTATVTITVTAQNDAPAASGAPLGASLAQVGQPVNLSVAAAFADVDVDALTLSADGLPAGVTLNPNTGVITGTPTQAGTFTVTITATDPSAAMATQTFTWIVEPAPAIGTTGAPAADAPPPPTQNLRTASYDTVLIKAVNDVKRLGGTEALTGSQALGFSVGEVQNLSATADLNQSSPMAAVVGDLSEGFRAPTRLDSGGGNAYGSGASALSPGLAAGLPRLDDELGRGGLPSAEPAGQPAAPAPETLAEQLVKNERRRRDELDDLAHALG
ncbi:Ig-like domain-containing protein [Roseateles sp. LKC17W]|uniref:Ig-like domain-containing protein n=1 Tax=Pelomonas margarita TaxID=3299031 RepID=A0ABW7FPJ5_9BURK